jgi:hypothetical protein
VSTQPTRDERLAEIKQVVQRWHPFASFRNQESDAPRLIAAELLAALVAVRAEPDQALRPLRDAADTAEHLHAMIRQEDWRATGGDDGQGHYEGDYRAESVLTNIRTWKRMAAVSSPGEEQNA